MGLKEFSMHELLSEDVKKLHELVQVNKLGSDKYTREERQNLLSTQRSLLQKNPDNILLDAYKTVTRSAVIYLCEQLKHLDKKPDCDEKLIVELTRYFLNKPRDLLQKEDIEFLANIYLKRWDEIKDESYDYTRNNQGANILWLNFVVNLDYWGLLPEKYPTHYHFVIPSIQNPAEDTITLEAITKQPLSNYILSHDSPELFLVHSIIKHHEINNAWGVTCQVKVSDPSQYIFLTDDFRELTDLEKSRLEHNASAKQYLEEQEKTKKEIPPISVKTYYELLLFVNYSFLVKGLRTDLNATEKTRAENGMKRFLAYVDTLNEHEREALLNQEASLGHSKFIFADIMKMILKNGSCVTLYSKYLIKLLLDFRTKTQFSQEIIRSDFYNGLLLTAAANKENKSLTDDTYLSERQCKYVIELMQKSIASTQFETAAGTGTEILIEATAKKTVPDSVAKIFWQLKNSEKNTNAKLFYIMHSIVIPKLLVRSQVRKLTTTRWLMNILIAPMIMFDDKALLSRIYEEMNNPCLSRKNRHLINELCKQLNALYQSHKESKAKFPTELYQTKLYQVIDDTYMKLSPDYHGYFIQSVLVLSVHQQKKLHESFDEGMNQLVIGLDSIDAVLTCIKSTNIESLIGFVRSECVSEYLSKVDKRQLTILLDNLYRTCREVFNRNQSLDSKGNQASLKRLFSVMFLTLSTGCRKILLQTMKERQLVEDTELKEHSGLQREFVKGFKESVISNFAMQQVSRSLQKSRGIVDSFFGYVSSDYRAKQADEELKELSIQRQVGELALENICDPKKMLVTLESKLTSHEAFTSVALLT